MGVVIVIFRIGEHAAEIAEQGRKEAGGALYLLGCFAVHAADYRTGGTYRQGAPEPWRESARLARRRSEGIISSK
jgi:hypothetical protein